MPERPPSWPGLRRPTRDWPLSAAAELPGPPPPLWRSPQEWPRQLAATLWLAPGRLSAAARAVYRSVVSYARARPVAFAILFVEFVVSVYFLTFAAKQLLLRWGGKAASGAATSAVAAAGAALSPRPLEVALSTFLRHLEQGAAKEVVLAPGRLTYLVDVARLQGPQGAVAGLPATAGGAAAAAASAAGPATQRLVAYTLNASPALLDRLMAAHADFRVVAPQLWGQLGPRLFMVGYLGFVFWMFRRMFTDNGAKALGKEARMVRETFNDVAGLAEAKGSVMEVVNILRNPAKYKAIGARMPAGLLLVGPPGGGKTLLARCLAGEAGVPFFACSGSDFVEVFAGRGASRVRALFSKAAAVAPCVIFIDELDALGKKRTMRLSSSNEDDQTLNQLLAAMDGFDTNNNGVVVVAATNRFNLLDEALIRPGRFDRIVRVELPTAPDREAILRVHLRNKAVDPALTGTQLRKVAEMTPNFSGAALAALVNEAAIGAVRRGGRAIAFEDLEQAVLQYRQSRGPGLSLFGELF